MNRDIVGGSVTSVSIAVWYYYTLLLLYLVKVLSPSENPRGFCCDHITLTPAAPPLITYGVEQVRSLLLTRVSASALDTGAQGRVCVDGYETGGDIARRSAATTAVQQKVRYYSSY